jgi:cytochrome c biogenesis protein CcmG/thiol:disulfide interchange protein DsbE
MKGKLRFVLPLVGFLLVAVVLAIALMHSPPAGQEKFLDSALIGKPAPDFSLPALGDPSTQVTMKSFLGSWTLVNVWGTWCYECRVEHQQLLNIKEEGKVKLLGLDYKDEDPDAPIQWLQKLGNPFDAVAADVEGRAAIDFGVYGAPETFLVNPQGIIVHKQVSIITAENWKRDFLPLIEGR